MPDDSTPELPDLSTALAAIERETGWHCWQGAIPMLYARREQTSPPWIVRAPTPEMLRKAIDEYERGKR